MKKCRWACGHIIRDHVRNYSIRERHDVDNFAERCRKARLSWFGHETRGETKNTSEERLWRGYHLRDESEEGRSRDGWTLSTGTREPSEQNMKSMTELVGGELCLPQRPHN